MSLKTNLTSLAQDAGMVFANPSSASVAINAINSEAYGAQNILLGDGSRYRAVFKRCRTAETHLALAAQNQRLQRFLAGDRYAALRKRLIVGHPVCHGSGHWLMFPFADGPSAYVAIRSSLRGRRLPALFQRALDIAAELDRACDETMSLASVIAQANSSLATHCPSKSVAAVASSFELAIGLAHLDFVPDNLLLGEQADCLIDFEYWDVAPVVFNLLDIMTTFGSLADLSPVSRRQPTDALRIFFTPDSGTMETLWASSVAFIEQTGLAGLSEQEVIGCVESWFAAKATAQPRVYGQRFGFSKDWLAYWDLARRGAIESLAGRWPR